MIKLNQADTSPPAFPPPPPPPLPLSKTTTTTTKKDRFYFALFGRQKNQSRRFPLELHMPTLANRLATFLDKRERHSFSSISFLFIPFPHLISFLFDSIRPFDLIPSSVVGTKERQRRAACQSLIAFRQRIDASLVCLFRLDLSFYLTRIPPPALAPFHVSKCRRRSRRLAAVHWFIYLQQNVVFISKGINRANNTCVCLCVPLITFSQKMSSSSSSKREKTGRLWLASASDFPLWPTRTANDALETDGRRAPVCNKQSRKKPVALTDSRVAR